MSKEEVKEKYGIEPIMKEMWVWNDDQENAFLCFVIYKKHKNKYPYITINKDRYGDIFKNASDTNPNKTKEPKVGDVGYFWSLDIKKGYTYGILNAINFNHWPFVCDSGVSFTHFSTEKQPWMK
jgi:hypothetical protein